MTQNWSLKSNLRNNNFKLKVSVKTGTFSLCELIHLTFNLISDKLFPLMKRGFVMKKAQLSETSAEMPKKNKKKLLIPLVALILVATIVIVAVSVGSSTVKPIKIYDAVKMTLFESGSISFTVNRKDSGESVSSKADFGDSMDDSYFLSEYKKGDSASETVLLVENGIIKESVKTQKNKDLSDYIDEQFALVGLAYGVDIDVEKLINDVINGKIEEKELSKVYDKEIIPILETVYSQEAGQNVELPDYYATMNAIEKFLKKGIGEDTVVYEKVKSENKGKTYKITVDAQAFAEDFATFAKGNRDLKPLLESLVAASKGQYKDIDDLAAKMIDTVSTADKIVFTVTLHSDRITYVAYDDIEIIIDSKK